jgi:intracellular septation protein
MKSASSKPYFLLSFIPALAYWYLETYYTLEIALVGGIVLGVLEMLLEKKFTGHVHTLSKLNVILIVILGGISLIAKEGLFFKLQPTLTGFALGGFLLYKKLKGQSLMIEMMNDLNQKLPLPEIIYRKMEGHMTFFLFIFALFMAWVAVKESTATWLFWKTGGFYIAFGAFMVVEMIFIRMMIWRMRR